MKIKFSAVIFDMDGVIVDSPLIWEDIVEQFFNEHVSGWTRKHTQLVEGMGIEDIFHILRQQYQISLTPQELKKFYREAGFDIYQNKVSLLPGVKELIQQLRKKNIPLGLGSSSEHCWVKTVVERFELEPFFQSIISADHVAKCKPAPDIFLKVAQELNIPCAECLVIEDSRYGVQAAKKAGMTCLALGENLPPEATEEADWIATSFAQAIDKGWF